MPTTAKVARAREVGRSRGRKRRDMAVGGGERETGGRGVWSSGGRGRKSDRKGKVVG